MAGSNPTKVREAATIDCCMIVLTPENGAPIGITSNVKITAEPQIETTEAVKLIIKGVLKAQKPESKTITGHTLTLTDNMTILEALPILQGGELKKDEQGNITGYTPPAVGQAYKPQKFTLDTYSSVLDTGGNVVKYEQITYPGCTGQPITLGSEDNVFRIHEYAITSAPGNGESPYVLAYVEALPTLQEPTVE